MGNDLSITMDDGDNFKPRPRHSNSHAHDFSGGGWVNDAYVHNGHYQNGPLQFGGGYGGCYNGAHKGAYGGVYGSHNVYAPL